MLKISMNGMEKEAPCFGHFDELRKTKNHLNPKDSSGFAMELLSRFELETSSLPRMRSTN